MKLCNQCPYTTIDTDAQKQIVVKILADFDAFCKKHNIRYCLTQGTLLGAVRHGGMIPWDDDIDIAVFREDYDRLIEYSKEMPNTCRFVSRETDGEFPRLYGRVCNTDYSVLDKFYSKKYIGFYGIDVFPIDAVPTEKAEYQSFAQKLKRLRRLFIFSNSAPFLGTDILRAWFIKPPLILFSKIIGSNRLFKGFKALATATPYDNAQKLAVLTGEYAEKEAFSKQAYLDLITVEFEGMQLPCVRNYDEYLTNLFGDYMTLPPIEQRKPHHNFYVFKTADM